MEIKGSVSCILTSPKAERAPLVLASSSSPSCESSYQLSTMAGNIMNLHRSLFIMAISLWISYSYLTTHFTFRIPGSSVIAGVITGLVWLYNRDGYSPLENSKVEPHNESRVVNMKLNYLDYSPRALILTVILPVAVIYISSPGSS